MIPDPSLDSTGQGEDNDGVSIPHHAQPEGPRVNYVRGGHCLDLDSHTSQTACVIWDQFLPLCAPRFPSHAGVSTSNLSIWMVSLRCQLQSTGCFRYRPQLWLPSPFITQSGQTILVTNSYPLLP